MKDNPQFCVLGSGRWGTAMAVYLARQSLQVRLYCPATDKLDAILKTRINPSLPDYALPENLEVSSDLGKCLQNAGVVVVSTPVEHLRSLYSRMAESACLPAKAMILGINKGIEQGTLKTPPQIAREFFPKNVCAQLGGPCFPPGLVEPGLPAAETLACEDFEIGRKLQSLISSDWFRVYLSRDVYGVASMGALKNVYAIGAGIIEGLGLNEEAMSIMITRALSEMRRFCRIMSIPDETLFGLSGLGDLALTCYSKSSSRNKTFGKLFSELKSTEATIAAMGHKAAEGYYTTLSVKEISKKFDISMPIVDTIHKILYEGAEPMKTLASLMCRPLKVED